MKIQYRPLAGPVLAPDPEQLWVLTQIPTAYWEEGALKPANLAEMHGKSEIWRMQNEGDQEKQRAYMIQREGGFINSRKADWEDSIEKTVAKGNQGFPHT